MGVVARYLDALSDEQRDRVIEARAWGEHFVDRDDPSCRCLVGHAEDWFYNTVGAGFLDARDPTTGERDLNLQGVPAFNQFPGLCYRFGTARIVRLVKARAAKGNNLSTIRTDDLRTVARRHMTRNEAYEHYGEGGTYDHLDELPTDDDAEVTP